MSNVPDSTPTPAQPRCKVCGIAFLFGQEHIDCRREPQPTPAPPKGELPAQKMFEGTFAEWKVADVIDRVFVDNWEDTGSDHYDESLEVYGVGNDFRPSKEGIEELLGCGFRIIYVNHKDGSETHYSRTALEGWHRTDPKIRGGERDPWKREFARTRAELTRSRAALLSLDSPEKVRKMADGFLRRWYAKPVMRPTIAELEAILSEPEPRPVEIGVDGSIGIGVREKEAEMLVAFLAEVCKS